MYKRVEDFFSEKKAPYSLFVLSLAAHLVLFYSLMFFYGPCVFFLSQDCSTNNNDTQHYVLIADNLSQGNGYSRFVDPPFEPDALRTPLMPLYFAPFTYFGGLHLIWLAMLFLNIILSLAGAMLYKLSRLFLPHSYALVAGLVLSLEPLYLYRSQIAEPDAVFVLLLIAAAYFLVRSWRNRRVWDLAICAFLLGLSVLAKPTAQYLAAIFVFFEILHIAFVAQTDRKERLTRVVAMFGIIVLVVFPWLARNKVVFGVAELSSIQGYNLYEYYTRNIPVDGDTVPPLMFLASREPSRYLPFQKSFIHVSIERIKHHPVEFIREITVGSLRNLFVSDISAIYYYGHTKILPFPYNPETQGNIHQKLLQGDFIGALKGFGTVPKTLWILLLGSLYLLAGAGWIYAYKTDLETFLVFTMFAIMFAYFIVASGPYVEAKYRLPGISFVIIAALFGFRSLYGIKNALRSSTK